MAPAEHGGGGRPTVGGDAPVQRPPSNRQGRRKDAPAARQYWVDQFDAVFGRRTLALHEVPGVDWRRALPYRAGASYPEQRHLAGREYCATTDTLIRVESRLEAVHVRLLDRDPVVSWIVAQPLRFSCSDDADWWHVPDLLAVRDGESPLLLDVVRDTVRSDERRVRAAERSREACDWLGWEYGVVGEIDQIEWENVSLLGRYRRAPSNLADYRPLLLTACTRPRSFRELRQLDANPLAVLPSLYHLIWRHELEADVRVRWTLSTFVSRGSRR